MFSFPALPAGPPSTQNWYQELLDHPACQNNPRKIQEAYEHHRLNSLSRSLSYFNFVATTADSESHSASPITPDAALIQHLSRPLTDAGSEGPLFSSPANCLVLWARPPPPILSLIESLQNRLSTLVGNDLHLIPLPQLHLSVLELSHNHTISQLDDVYKAIGEGLLRSMLKLPLAEELASHERETEPRLVKPQLMVDRKGVAVTFVPDCAVTIEEGRKKIDEQKDKDSADDVAVKPDSAAKLFTYHHLRASLHDLALSSGVEIDTCYTAPTAHITIARFVSSDFFDAYLNDQNDSNSESSAAVQPPLSTPNDNLCRTKASRAASWVELVGSINEELRIRSQGPDPRKELEWVVGQGIGLEVQLGYVKFGRKRERAKMLGPSVSSE